MTWWVSTLRLASILAALGLVTTRIGLVLHEWAGHGGVAVACGGTIERVRLFWFAGGWIHYDLPKDASLAAHVASTMGGIGLELVLGTIVWFVLARRKGLVVQVVRACAAAFVIHAAWYLSVGTYHGFGDGTIVRFVAGDTKRYLIALPAGAVVIAMCYFGARQIMGVLAGSLPTRRWTGLVVAVLIAAGFQGALVMGEMSVRRDENYAVAMQPERERRAEYELMKWVAQQKKLGVQVDAAARDARAAELKKKHRELPYGWILGTLSVVAIVAGTRRSKIAEDVVFSPRFVLTASTLAVASVALVIAIDAAFA